MKPIPGYSDYYITDDFQVLSMRRGKGRVIGHVNPDHGYKVACLVDSMGRRRHWRVHQLVLLAHGIPRPSKNHGVRHLDGNKLNNRIENLAWGTHGQNMKDKEAHGTIPRGEGHYCAKLTEAIVLDLRRQYSVAPRGTKSQLRAKWCQRYDVADVTLHQALLGQTWKHI